MSDAASRSPGTPRPVSPLIQALAQRAPRTGVPFLEAFRVQHGPPGLLGRFFLSADQRLRERGVTVQFITFDELVDANQRNLDNWGFFNPMFDPRCSIIAPGSMCLAALDADGVVRVTISAKPYDATTETFASIVNAGGFFDYRPGHNVEDYATLTDAPVSKELKGLLGYCGALWVHPDYRGVRFASIVPNIIYGCMLTLWNPSYIVGLVPSTAHGTGLHQRYNFAHSAPSLSVTRGGKPAFDLVYMWESADEAYDALARYLDVLWPQIDAAVAARHRKQTA